MNQSYTTLSTFDMDIGREPVAIPAGRARLLRLVAARPFLVHGGDDQPGFPVQAFDTCEIPTTSTVFASADADCVLSVMALGYDT